MVSAGPGVRRTGGIGEQVRCERVRDQAAGRAAPAVRGPLVGGGPQQVKVVHHQGPRRQLPGRTGPRRPDGPGLRSADRRAGRMEPPGTLVCQLVPAGHRVRRDEMAVPGRPLPGQPGRIASHGHARTDPARCRAAANTIIRKRAVLHGALGYATETGLLTDNPLDTIAWQVPRSSAALNPAVVASPAQVSALLDAVDRTRPERTPLFSPPVFMHPPPPRRSARAPSPPPRPAREGECSGSPRPRPGPPRPGPAAAPAMNSADSSTGRTGRSAWSRSPRWWPPWSGPTSRPTAPHPTAGCSTEPAAGRSADRSTAAPGNPPAHSPSGPS